MDEYDFQLLFNSYMDDHEYGAAVAFARMGKERDPESKVIAESLAIVLWMVGKESQALEELECLQGRTELSTTAMIVLSRCYLGTDRRRLAVKTLRTVLWREDCPIQGLPTLAASFGRMGEYALALQVCHRLTALIPDFPDGWYGVAYYQHLLGVAPQVLIYPLSRVLRIEPRCLAARMCLANAHVLLEDWEAAYRLVSIINVSMIKARSWLELLDRIAKQNEDRLLSHLAESQLEMNVQRTQE